MNLQTLKCRIPIWAVALFACSHSESAPEAFRADSKETAPLAVFVVNYPLLYFAERIGGDQVKVTLPAPADVDPAHWSPDPETVAAYQRADLILLNGAGYAGWVDRATLPTSKLVDTSAAFRDRLMPLEERVAHTHGPEGEHSHKETASTTWLDPTLAVEQARSIADAFTRARPTHGEAFRAGLEALDADLHGLDGKLAAVAESLAGQPLLFSHPVYQYFVRRYSLNGRSLHWEPDQPFDERMRGELEDVLATHPARWMIWEAATLADTATRLRQRSVDSVVVDPCANRPQAGDFLSVMESNLAGLEKTARIRRRPS